MVLEKCRFCLELDDVTKLVDPCDCYKKNDSLLCHAHCLEEHIAEMKRSERDSISEKADYCPQCQRKFRVKLLWRWTNKRILSPESCTQYFNIIALLITCSAFFYCAYTLFHSGELSQEPSQYISSEEADLNAEKRIIVNVGVAVIFFTALFVLRKLYLRWKRHQMNLQVIDVI